MEDEAPVHEVRIDPFLLSKFEMTQGQWLRFTRTNPSIYQPGKKPPGARNATLLNPVTHVSWDVCNRVLQRLNLRFPTEPEWEYAARAGTATPWHTGVDEKSLKGYANLCDRRWAGFQKKIERDYETWLDDGFRMHAPVGTFLPNAFGLHDIHGNVFEWCRGAKVGYATAMKNPDAGRPSRSIYRISRGGCWFYTAEHCRVSSRHPLMKNRASIGLSVRPACPLR